ncbi:MAG: ATP-dependent Clp protease proteolytic subunit [Methyloceanibacter sp.]
MTAYILFTKGIDQDSATTLVDTLLAAAAANEPDAYILMNSPGGQVISGMYLHNVLRSLPLRITTHNIGNVDSISNVIFLAGETRRACQPATFMFHGIGFDILQPTRLEENNVRARLDSIVADHTRIGGVISARTNLTLGRARTLFREQRVRDTAWALQHGFIQEIADPQTPAGVAIKQIV